MPRSSRSLLWPVFSVNAAVLVAFGGLLLLTPVTVSSSVVLAEAAVVLVSLAVLLVANLLLLRRALRPLRELASAMGRADPLAPETAPAAAPGASLEIDALIGAFDRMLRRLEDERRTSTRRALQVQEEERRRIALELHDHVGQSLTAAAIEAESAGASGVAAELRATLDDVRRIARELRPEALDDLGLANALIALGRRMDAAGTARVRTHLGERLPPLSEETELVLYRVAQEGLTNAVRHAGATAIELRLDVARDRVSLEVLDDGTGIPRVVTHPRGPDSGGHVAASATPRETAGLAGMAERAMLVKGRLTVAPRRAGGTEVRLEVPA